MNVKKLLTNTLLVATLLIGGGNFAWAETIGTTSDAYLTAKSTSITLTDGGSVSYVFSQTTAATQVWQGFILVANTTSGTELVKLRQDNWELVSASRVGITLHTIDDVNTVMNGATVAMTVSYSSGTFTMSSTIYGSDNGEYTYGYTKTIDGAPASIVVYLSEEAAQIRIGKVAVTNGNITTTTYDFTSMIPTSTTFTYGDALGKVYGQNAKIPTNISVFTDGRLSLWDRGSFWSISSTGLLHSHTANKSNTGGIYIGSLSVGDKIVYTFSSTTGDVQAASTNSSGNSTLTADGTTLTYWSNLTSGSSYYITSGAYASVVIGKNINVTDITIRHNTSTNYATLFALWKTAVEDYNNESYTEGKGELATAISAAKAVLDADEAPADDYVAAITALREANEYFTAINTLNTSYRVTSSNVMSDGTNVKSVYGITMTYRGSWSWTTERNGNAAGTTVPTLEHNMPIAGDYWEFKPTVDGTLTIKAAWFSDQYYELTDENGNIIMNFRQDHSDNDYNKYVDYGSLIAGKTYYFFRTSTTHGYYLGGFTFTPGENNRTSYTACNGEIIKGGYIVNSVAGITMTYGGTSADTWSYATDRPGAYLTDDATVSGSTPTGNTYLIFNPVVNGILTISNYFFLGNGNCHLYLSDGSNVEDKGFGKGSGNGSYTNNLSTILKAGDTYYVYFADGYGCARFQGFTFTPTPATIPATIGGTGFATFSSEYPLDFSATTTKAYAASLTDDNTVLLSPVTTVPANTGLLLKGATEDIPVKAGFVSAPEINLFVGLLEETTIPATDAENNSFNYVLAKGSNGLGFYNLASNKTIGAGKAYLHTTTALAADGDNARVAWLFSDDDMTGIQELKNSRTEGLKAVDCYNLSGQRVSQPTKGLYIVNGKKVIMK